MNMPLVDLNAQYRAIEYEFKRSLDEIMAGMHLSIAAFEARVAGRS
jgi:hypothetical protein